MSDEVAFSVVGGKVEQLTEVSLEDIGFRERKHLQRWIEDYPEIVGPDLLMGRRSSKLLSASIK